MKNKDEETDEIRDEIESALKDPKGILSHQKRLAFCLSLGVVNILEGYLKNKAVLKQGVKLNHQWFKKKRENAKKILSSKITSPLDRLGKIDRILDAAYNIETKRDDLAYGKKASENSLKNLINGYLELKKEIEGNEE